VQPAHHLLPPPGATAPWYAVAVTNVPALVAMAPPKAFSPPVAIGEPAAGVKSNAEMSAGAVPTVGIVVKSDAAVAVLSVRLFVVESSWNCVAEGVWKSF